MWKLFVVMLFISLFTLLMGSCFFMGLLFFSACRVFFNVLIRSVFSFFIEDH